jgi:hypothetical protein|tara:strand:- start:100 stop:336 length:237 start_codon:yes stop_codon:yes gene_type:complete
MVEVNKGDKFRLSFNIDGSIVPTTAIFSGTVINIDDQKIFICMLASGKEYGFTQKQLNSFAQWNDESLRETVDSFTMG